MASLGPSFTSTGLDGAIKEVPALAVPILLALAVLQIALPQAPWMERAPPWAQQTLLTVAATLIGLVLHSLGDFWDGLVFDRLYGPGGAFLRRGRRPWLVFPSAVALDRNRQQWNELAGPDDGGYRGARETVRGAGRWGEVEGALLLSKFARTFIWPGLLIGYGCAVAAFGAGAQTVPWGSLAAAAWGLTLASFIPYLHFRVDHVERLYRLALALRRSGDGPPPHPPESGFTAGPAPSNTPSTLLSALLAALVGYLLAGAPRPAAPPSPGLDRETIRQAVEQGCRDCRAASAPSAAGPSVTVIEHGAGGTPTAPVAPPSEPAPAGASWAVVVASVTGLLALVVGLLLLPFKKQLGTAVASAGAALSIGSVMLFKELKVDSVFKFGDFKLPPVNLSLGSAGPELQRFGDIGRFVTGQVESPGVDAAIQEAAAKWLDERVKHKNAVVLLIGGADRQPLSGPKARRFDANAGLAQARGEYVKARLIDEVRRQARQRGLNDPPAYLPEDRVIVLISGPGQTPELSAPGRPSTKETGFEADRKVQIWTFWGG